MLVGGHDFFASPRLSPDGRWLIWLAWDHPNMPWNGTTLYLSELDEAGNVTELLSIAGSVSESVFQPEWSADGRAIFFVSDRSNWWNLYRFDLASRTSEPLAPMAAEFGVPLWRLGASTYACAGPDRIVCAYSTAGLGQLAVLDLKARCCDRSRRHSQSSVSCGLTVTARYFAPARLTTRPASSCSI